MSEIGTNEFTADDICERLRPIRNRLDELASFATKDHSGSGGWWELSGYAEILDDAMKRIRSHRARVENVDRQIAREAQKVGYRGTQPVSEAGRSAQSEAQKSHFHSETQASDTKE